MNHSHISPLIESAQHVFATMLRLDVVVEQPALRIDGASGFDVSVIIGVTGDVIGSIVLSFPRETAERVTTLLTGDKMSVSSEDFADAIGELCNMICGGARGELEGAHACMASPCVVIGHNHHVARQKERPCVAVPCETDCGMFMIEVGMHEAAAASCVAV